MTSDSRSPGFVELVKIEIAKRAPDWLYCLLKALYSMLFSPRRFVILLPLGKCWIAMKSGRKLFVPSPKGDWGSFIIDPSRASGINEGDVVVEVGACLGATALSLANKAGKIIAIEPEPKNLKFLSLNVRFHGYRNILIVNKAVWSSRGKLRLYTTTTATGHTLTPSVFSYVDKPLTGKVIKVEVDTLDNILAELGIEKVDVLLMNVEGAEVEALKGAEETLKKVRRVSIVCHSRELRDKVYNF